MHRNDLKWAEIVLEMDLEMDQKWTLLNLKSFDSFETILGLIYCENITKSN